MGLQRCFVFDNAENIVGKDENADKQHFLLFQRCFKRLLPKNRKNKESVVKGCSQLDNLICIIDVQEISMHNINGAANQCF